MPSVLVNDLWLARSIRLKREKTDESRYDEVWDGVYVVPPSRDHSHQRFVAVFGFIIHEVLDWNAGDAIYPGINVTDRVKGWKKNYRIPDVAVVLRDNPNRKFDAAIRGGPDFLVEVLSKNDRALEKLDFYASVGVREVLILDRNPWGLALYRLDNGRLDLAGRSALGDGDPVVSAVLPLNFRLVEGETRVRVEVRHNQSGQTWLA